MARAAQQSPGQDISLPELIKQVGPMMDSIPIEARSLDGALSLITGPGGNITALAGPDGVVMVDAFVPSKGAELAPIVRKLGEGPITLINTHWHFDHSAATPRSPGSAPGSTPTRPSGAGWRPSSTWPTSR